MNKDIMWDLLNSIYNFSININRVLNSINPNITYFILKQKVYSNNLECIYDGKIKIVSGSLYINLNIVILDSEIIYIYLSKNIMDYNHFNLHFEKCFILRNNNIHVYNPPIFDQFILDLKTPNKHYFNIENNNFISKENYYMIPEIIMKVI